MENKFLTNNAAAGAPDSGVSLCHAWASRTFRGEVYRACEQFFRTRDGIAFTTTAQDSLNVQQVYNQYRAAHGLPYPGEIRTLRARCALSPAQMSAMLGFEAGDYARYEAGELPSQAHAQRMYAVAERVHRADTKPAPAWNTYSQPNEYTGYVKPDFEKAAQFVLYFAERMQPLKTKLNKLLYFADFDHYRHTGFGISGIDYRAIQLGPVPSHFREFFELLEQKGFLAVEQENTERGTGERFIALQPFDSGFFSPSELAAMDAIAVRFEETRTQEIVDISHEETGWRANVEEKALISYLAFALPDLYVF